MNRLLMSAWLAAFAMSGALPDAMAAEAASSGAETAAASAGSSKTAGAKATHLKASGSSKLSNKNAKTASKTANIRPVGTKAAREAEAAEAVTTADAPQSADASASDLPADAAAADPANTASQSADARSNDTATDPALDPAADANADQKPAAAKPIVHMNTGHPQIDALVAVHAKANNVPEALIHRVIVRESKYQKDLVGSCGCIGLMQIKLGTARGLGYTGDAQGLHDPNTNLTYGVKYLAGAYRAANGDHDRAVHYFAKGYYEVAKRQRLADANSFARPERIHAPLDIRPKVVAAAHVPKRIAAVMTKPVAAGASDAQAAK